MKYNLQTKNCELSELDHKLIEEKLNRLNKYLMPPFVIDVVFDRNTHHLSGDVFTCIIRVEQGKRVFHAERAAETSQSALDESFNAMSRELAKERDKRKKHF